MTADLIPLVEYLDSFLRIADVPDDPRALNGLQVENSGLVRRVVAAVDACQATIEAAARHEGALLLVHHGLFWGGLQALTGRHGRRVRRLHAADVALYAAHLPLDLHPAVGNNPVLGRALGLTEAQPFGEYRGTPIGVVGGLDAARDELVSRLTSLLGAAPRVIAKGPERVRRVAIVTGAASDLLPAARAAGADTFVTGEGPHHTYFDAEEWGLNLIYAGHYATETVGVKALAAHLAERYGLEWEFVDHPTGL